MRTSDFIFVFVANLTSSIHVIVKEQISANILREGGLKSMELKGDMNLQITDASQGQIKLEIAPSTTDFGSDLQFKQHPKVAKFGEDRIIGLLDSSRSFPIGQSIAVLRWRYSGKDESYLPLSSRWSCVPKINWEINWWYFSQLLANTI